MGSFAGSKGGITAGTARILVALRKKRTGSKTVKTGKVPENKAK